MIEISLVGKMIPVRLRNMRFTLTGVVGVREDGETKKYRYEQIKEYKLLEGTKIENHPEA